ncbi:uncharacterized protein NESG_01011 [Nematocida ausubeli]|uniref:ATPase AAA-type core domain-containing protein n=1 Tax=Nematocida ausubeli (strain ATCC PRA-371 / ERTm2) TaxID=1913371 RepID=A0A086J3Y7_NEMA1|nr:uncharacterized protein NESG_01011 [Nematocida ausubeli]KAI5135184.1 hypothetical protein NEAUS07_1044 [Nematocida ausubeli]KAI5147787.1 hypothetical protein NEAUS05_1070 [Nematocida ausubeli]KFG26855.1 hypothetical protein NESG_01011 [Nematocida ausubeli]
MGKPERKIAVKARLRINEAALEREKRMQQARQVREENKAKNIKRVTKAKEKEIKEKLKEIEKKKPLKKALAVAEIERKKEEAKNLPKRKRGRPRTKTPEGVPLKKKKKKQPGENGEVVELDPVTGLPIPGSSKRAKQTPEEAALEKERRAKLKKEMMKKVEEVLHDPERKDKIRERICSLSIDGRSEEIKEIAECITESSRHTLYIHGKPGTGKTYVMEKIAQILDEEGVEVYYSNLLIDKAFKKTGRAISATVVLVVDEFEGARRDKLFVRHKEKLERLFRKEERKKFSFKVVLISNEYNSKGIQFKPYKEEAIKHIVEKKDISSESKVQNFMRLHNGVEKADLRAIMTKRIEPIPANNNEALGQYHQFLKKKVQEGNTNINEIYSEFLKKMKEQGASVLPKEMVKEIIEGYMDGTFV